MTKEPFTREEVESILDWSEMYYNEMEEYNDPLPNVYHSVIKKLKEMLERLEK